MKQIFRFYRLYRSYGHSPLMSLKFAWWKVRGA